MNFKKLLFSTLFSRRPSWGFASWNATWWEWTQSHMWLVLRIYCQVLRAWQNKRKSGCPQSLCGDLKITLLTFLLTSLILSLFWTTWLVSALMANSLLLSWNIRSVRFIRLNCMLRRLSLRQSWTSEEEIVQPQTKIEFTWPMSGANSALKALTTALWIWSSTLTNAAAEDTSVVTEVTFVGTVEAEKCYIEVGWFPFPFSKKYLWPNCYIEVGGFPFPKSIYDQLLPHGFLLSLVHWIWQ